METQGNMNIYPSVVEDHFRIVQPLVRTPQPTVVVQQVTSLEGYDVIMLTSRHKDEKCTRVVNVCYDANAVMPIGKHITFKSDWDLDRLANIYEKKGETIFRYMVTDRYKQHLTTYIADYRIGQSLTINIMRKTRPLDPYIVGNTMQEKIQQGFHMLLVHS
jgi:hypothetical protein